MSKATLGVPNKKGPVLSGRAFFIFNFVYGFIDDAFSNRFFAADHQDIDELGKVFITKFRVR